jgi:hypothetical protein
LAATLEISRWTSARFGGVISHTLANLDPATGGHTPPGWEYLSRAQDRAQKGDSTMPPTELFDELDLREEPNRGPAPDACSESTILSQSCLQTKRCSEPCCL